MYLISNVSPITLSNECFGLSIYECFGFSILGVAFGTFVPGTQSMPEVALGLNFPLATSSVRNVHLTIVSLEIDL